MRPAGKRGTVPDGWCVVRLGNVARVETGGTPSRTEQSYWGGSVPWMVSGEVNQRRVVATAETVTKAGLDNSNAREFPMGTLMLAMNGQGSTRGKVALLGVEAACNQSLAAITGIRSDNLFLFHLLQASYDRLRALTGDGRSGLNLALLRSLPILLPPMEEQRAIAVAMDAIDDAIELTVKVTAATEQLRDSLLEELLTRGVPGWHKEWKEVLSLGTIPANWEVLRLGDVCGQPKYGAGAPAMTYDSSLPRYVRISDLTEDGHLRDENARSADPSQVLGYELEPGDIVFARSGATVGKTYMHRLEDGPCVYGGYLIRFRVASDLVVPDFLRWFTHSRPYAIWVASMYRAGAQPNINGKEYASLPVPLPPEAEQQSIAATLNRIDNVIGMAHAEQGKLLSLRASAREALLTGQVRIPPKVNMQSVGE